MSKKNISKTLYSVSAVIAVISIIVFVSGLLNGDYKSYSHWNYHLLSPLFPIILSIVLLFIGRCVEGKNKWYSPAIGGILTFFALVIPANINLKPLEYQNTEYRQPQTNSIMLLLLIIGIGLVVFFLILAFAKGGKDTLKQLGLSTSIKNTGYDSPSTILIIRDIIIKSLLKDGTNVIDLNIVHEIEGRYQGILSTEEYGEVTIKIIADRLGNLQWSEIE